LRDNKIQEQKHTAFGWWFKNCTNES